VRNIAREGVQNTHHSSKIINDATDEWLPQWWHDPAWSSKANAAFHPSVVGKWIPSSAEKANAGMVHSVSGWTRGVWVKLWDPLRTRAIPDRFRGVFTTRRYTNPRLPYLTLPWSTPFTVAVSVHSDKWCVFCTPFLEIRATRCNQLDSNLANLGATIEGEEIQEFLPVTTQWYLVSY